MAVEFGNDLRPQAVVEKPSEFAPEVQSMLDELADLSGKLPPYFNRGLHVNNPDIRKMMQREKELHGLLTKQGVSGPDRVKYIVNKNPDIYKV